MILATPTITSDCQNTFTLSCEKARLEVFLSGASIHNYQVLQNNGNIFEPFAEANWLDDHRDVETVGVPRHLQLIGGEFPCVPFGKTTFDDDHHGYGVNNDWQLVEQGDHFAALEIEYPNNHTIRSLRRTVSLCEKTGARDLSLEINVRGDCKIPIGVHPIFKIPTSSEAIKIVSPNFEYGAEAPKTLHNNEQLTDDQPVLLYLGSDIWNSVVNSKTQLFQLWNVSGGVSLEYSDENCIVDLTWNREQFPHCLFWVANPDLEKIGLGDGFVGLGIEPTNSFFDANDKANEYLSLHNQGLDGFGVHLKANETWKTQYNISCRQIANKTSENVK